MADLGIWNRQETPNGLIKAPQVDTSAGEALGAGLQSVGQSGMQLDSDLFRQEQVRQQRQQQTNALQRAQGVAKVRSGLVKGYADMENSAAPGAPGFSDQVDKLVDDSFSDLVKNAPDPETRSEIETEVSTTKAAYASDAIRFQNASQLAQKADALQGTLDLNSNVVANDRRQFDTVLQSTLSAIDAQGLPADKVADFKTKATQALASSAIGGMVESDPRAAMRELDSGRWNDKLDAARFVSLKNQAASGIRSLDAQDRQDAREAALVRKQDLLVRLDESLPSMQATGTIPTDGKGNPIVSRDEIKAAFGDNQRTAETYLRKFDASLAVGQDQLAMKGTSLEEDQAKRDTLAPKPGQAFTPEDQARLDSFDQAYSAKAKMLATDPAAWVRQSQNSPVAKAWTTRDALAADPKADPKAVQRATATAVGATIKAQTDAGVPSYLTKPLTKGEAADYAGRLNSAADPTQLIALSKQVVGLGPAALRQVIDAGAKPGVAALAATDDPVFTQLLANGMAMQPDDKSKILKAKNISEGGAGGLDDEITTKMADLAETLPPASIPLYRDAVKDVAIQWIGRGKGMDDAIGAALGPLTAGSTIVKGLRIPSNLDTDAVTRGLDTIVSQASSGTAPLSIVPPPSGLPGSSSATDMQAVQQALRTGNYQWVTNENGDGAILTIDGRYLQSIDRTSNFKATTGRFEVPFSDAAAAGANKPAWVRPSPGVNPPVQSSPATQLPSFEPMRALKLTPQEQFLYQGHVNNITGTNGGKAVHNADGSTSTVLQMSEPSDVFGLNDGQWRNIPSVWDGKTHTEDEAIDHAKRVGVDKFPTYSSSDEAESRYQKMHDVMELDVPDKAPVVAYPHASLPPSVTVVPSGGHPDFSGIKKQPIATESDIGFPLVIRKGFKGQGKPVLVVPKAEPDALGPNDMVDEPAPFVPAPDIPTDETGDQSSASDVVASPIGYSFNKPIGPDGKPNSQGDGGGGLLKKVVLSSIRLATPDQLKILAEQAVGDDIREAAKAELKRRSGRTS